MEKTAKKLDKKSDKKSDLGDLGTPIVPKVKKAAGALPRS